VDVGVVVLPVLVAEVDALLAVAMLVLVTVTVLAPPEPQPENAATPTHASAHAFTTPIHLTPAEPIRRRRMPVDAAASSGRLRT
jgi:hypothetical protein